MQADDQIAEWLVRWEEARAANLPPPSLDQLPPELRRALAKGCNCCSASSGCRTA